MDNNDDYDHGDDDDHGDDNDHDDDVDNDNDDDGPNNIHPQQQVDSATLGTTKPGVVTPY